MLRLRCRQEDGEGEEEYGTRVLDLGCGTGILGISSIVVGASHVTALDTDPSALSKARQNYEKMEMEDMVTFVEGTLQQSAGEGGDGIDLEDGTFDVVLTNPPFGTKNNAGIDVAFLKVRERCVRRDERIELQWEGEFLSSFVFPLTFTAILF